MDMWFEFNKNGRIISLDYDSLVSKLKERYKQIHKGKIVDYSDFPEDFPKEYAIPPGMSVLIEDMVEAIKSDRLNVYLFAGQPGAGKSSLAYWLAYKIYGDWDIALLHTVLDPFQLFDLAEASIKHGIAIPLIVLDDAGLLFSTMMYQDRERYNTFLRALQVLRTTVKNVVLTTPNESGINKKLLQHVNKMALVETETEKVSRTRLYHVVVTHMSSKVKTPKWRVRKSEGEGVSIISLLRSEQFSNVIYTPRHMPDFFFNTYMELRTQYIKILNEYELKLLESKSRKRRSEVAVANNDS